MYAQGATELDIVREVIVPATKEKLERATKLLEVSSRTYKDYVLINVIPQVCKNLWLEKMLIHFPKDIF